MIAVFIGVVSLVLLAVLILAGVNLVSWVRWLTCQYYFGVYGLGDDVSTFILSTLLNRIVELSECG